MRDFVLSFDEVGKSFGNRTVLKNISLQLRQGECIALLGPNGAGKSTVIQLALGLLAPNNGRVSLLGCEGVKAMHQARQEVGVVPQYDALDPDFTIEENLRVFGGYFRVPNVDLVTRVESLLQFAALESRRHESVVALSGGMRRRLMLARALINQPKVLFLDEPTTALDPQAKHLMWERLVDLKRSGLSLFLTTHYMDEAQRLADCVVVIDRGGIVAQGTPQALIREYVPGPVIEIWGEGASTWLHQTLGEAVDGLVQRGEIFYGYATLAQELLSQLGGQKSLLVEYVFRPSNLEDVFFHLTGRDLRDD